MTENLMFRFKVFDLKLADRMPSRKRRARISGSRGGVGPLWSEWPNLARVHPREPPPQFASPLAFAWAGCSVFVFVTFGLLRLCVFSVQPCCGLVCHNNPLSSGCLFPALLLCHVLFPAFSFVLPFSTAFVRHCPNAHRLGQLLYHPARYRAMSRSFPIRGSRWDRSDWSVSQLMMTPSRNSSSAVVPDSDSSCRRDRSSSVSKSCPSLVPRRREKLPMNRLATFGLYSCHRRRYSSMPSPIPALHRTSKGHPLA